MIIRLKIVFPVFLLSFLAILISPAVGLEFMNVQVKKTQVRSSPSFLGKILTDIPYAKMVYIVEKKAPWIKVGIPVSGIEGWVHASALTTQKIEIKAGASDVAQAATDDEVALAGKGFNKQVEREFRLKNQDIDFTWIDKMEAIVISPVEMQKFLQEGSIFPEGGLK